MEQSELDKNEEQQAVSSSVELSESEAAAAPETTEEIASEAIPTEADVVEDAVETEVPAEAETEQPESESPSEEVVTDEASAAPENDNGLEKGQLIEGTISNTTPTAVFVDLGDGLEGVVPGRELEMMPKKMLEDLQVGKSITVYVVNPHSHRGEILLSVNHAMEELDWQEAERYFKSKEVYDARIGGYNKGGLIVRFGRLRGFVPQSQISEMRQIRMSGDTPEEQYGGMVNEPLSVKVMEVDRSRNRLILSERAAMREIRQARKESLINELQVGEIREGTVVSLENFGAFVDVGGAEGLVHLTELSWKHVTHPRQSLSVGQRVKVKIISVDPDRNRIGLSIRELQADPWDEIAIEYSVGQLVEANITKLTKFGAFAKLVDNPAVEGLVHISELSEERVQHPKDVVKEKDRLTLRIVKIDVKNRRLGLSLKRVNSAEYLDQDLNAAFTMAEMNEQYSESEPAEASEETLQDKAEDVVEAVEEIVEEIVEKVQDVVEDVVEAVENALDQDDED